MKIKIWSNLSENTKKALAVIAILQAIHFIITVPLGVYDGWRWNKDFQHNVFFQPRSIAAEHAIVANIVANENATFTRGGYKEECLDYAAQSDENMKIWEYPQSDCDKLQTLAEIIDTHIEFYQVREEDIEGVLLSLSVLYDLPVQAK